MADEQKEHNPPVKSVFRIKPDGDSIALKFKGTCPDKIEDEMIDLTNIPHKANDAYGNNSLAIKKIGSYDIVGFIYRSNINSSYIATGLRYPLMYLTINYYKGMMAGSILQLVLSFDIDRDEKKKLKNKNNYANIKLAGNWIQHIDCEVDLQQDFEAVLTEHLENEALSLYFSDETLKMSSRTQDEIAIWAEEYVNEHRKLYKQYFDSKKFEFKSVKDAIKYFVSLCEMDDFYKFLCVAIKCRDLRRRKNLCVETYNVPKKVCKMTSIIDELLATGDLIEDT